MHGMIALLIGIGLSATCGFRVFVPLLGMSIAHRAGYLMLNPGFEWIGSYPVMFALAVATITEIGAYYIPWLDNLLDTIATPGAIMAGTLVTASMAVDGSPFLRWSLAVIAGGGVAGLIQGSSMLLRGASSTTTGGACNPIISTAELSAAVAGTFLSIVVPFVMAALVSMLIVFLLRKVIVLRRKSTATKRSRETALAG